MNPKSATDHLSLLSEPIGPIDESDVISLDLQQAAENTVQRRPSYQEEMKQAVDDNDGHEIVWNDWDVPIGRGRAVREFVGNERYRDLVDQFRPMYLRVRKRKEKRDVSVTIYNTIKSNGGRFLAPCGRRSETWREISKEKALAKIGQALRIGVRPPQPLHSSWTYPMDDNNHRDHFPSETPRPLFVNMPFTRSSSDGLASVPADFGDNISNLSFTSDDRMMAFNESSGLPSTEMDSSTTHHEWKNSDSFEPHTFM